jgi:MFS superfamily sulfate permease-like transporter
LATISSFADALQRRRGVAGLASSREAAHPRVDVIGRKRGEDVLRPLSPENPDAETFEGLLILRPGGRLCFANAQSVSDTIRKLVDAHRPRVLLLDRSRVFDIEYSAIQMMMEGERRFASEGVVVWMAALNPKVLASIRACGLAERLGEERLFPNARVAIRRYMQGATVAGTGTAE